MSTSRSSASHSCSGEGRHADGDADEARPRAAAHLLRREIGRDAIGIERLLGIEHVLIRHQRVERRVEPRLDGDERAPARPPKRFDRAMKAPFALERPRDFLRGAPEMLGEQAVAQSRDELRQRRIITRLDREIAFGVDAERALGQVRRADHQQRIIDDHHLAVHVEAAFALVEPVERGTVQAIAAVKVGRTQRMVNARAKRPHRRDFEPAALHVRGQHGNLRSLVLCHAAHERVGDRA